MARNKAGAEGGKGHITYVPDHPDTITDLPKADMNRAGYVGMADGVQSEASTDEAASLLGVNNVESDKDGMRIRNPGGKAWYTKHFNQG